MPYTRLMAFATLLVGGTLTGCSDDGGFFPGMLTHNEGAVDYRVAPLNSETFAGLRSDSQTLKQGWTHLLPLGTEASAPYRQLDDVEDLRSYWKIMPPESVRGATDKLNASAADHATARAEKRAADEAVRDLNIRLKTAEQEVNDANAAKNSAEGKLGEFRRLFGQAGYTPPDQPPVDGTEERKAYDRFQQLAADLDSANVTSDRASKRSDELRDQLKIASERASLAQTTLDTRAAAEAASRREYDDTVKSWRNPVGAAQGGDSSLERVESIRVTLKQAYLRKFRENGPVGEVAVLMTVKESRASLGQQEPRSGRVVYYSEGVRKDAFMNFRDQPVYGPIRYGGDDLQIRVSIIELDDNDNGIAGSMLKSLATLGSVVYPPSSPVLSALDKIGESLLALNGPDLEWDYLMRLSSRPPADPLGDSKWRDSQVDAWLRDGYYVMIRSDTAADQERRRRISIEDWKNLYLDPYSGILYTKAARPASNSTHNGMIACNTSDGSCSFDSGREDQFIEYTDRSYLVFAIQSGFDSSQLDLAQEAAELGEIVNAFGGANPTLGNASKIMADGIAKSIKDLKDRKDAESKMRDVR